MEYASVLLVFLLAGVLLYGMRPLQWWRLRHIPGPRGWWLLGSIPEVLKVGIAQLNLDLAAKFGPVFKIGYAQCSMVAVADPQLAREVLRHSSMRPHWWPEAQLSSSFEKSMVQTPLLVNGPLWKSMRPTWQSIFFTGSLEKSREMMDVAAVKLAQEVAAACSCGPVDIYRFSTRMAFDNITQAGLGWVPPAKSQKIGERSRKPSDTAEGMVDSSKGCGIDHHFAEERWEGLTQDTVTFFMSGTRSVWVVLWLLFPFLKPLLRGLRRVFPEPLLESIITARQRLEDAVASSIRSPAPNAPSLPPTKAEMRSGVPPGAFPALLERTVDSRSGTCLAEEVRIQQGLTMVLAGTDTTSSAVANACHLLAHPGNRAAQVTLLAEIDAAGGGSAGEGVLPEEMLQLPYLDAVVKETLRVLPPAHMTARVAPRPMHVGGYVIPKGQFVFIPIFAIHRDPHYWGPDAATFRPERWLDISPEHLRHQAVAFMPFGDGPRTCPGSKFALQEAKLALFRLLERCTLQLAHPDEPLKMRRSATMGPSEGVWLNVSARKAAA